MGHGSVRLSSWISCPARDLATVIRRVGALPTQAARIASEVSRALAAAHARKDRPSRIKPGNILLANDGRVLVTDFGIARALAEAQMTPPGMTMGSVQYTSPEQGWGEVAYTERSARRHLLTPGVVLFEMLAAASVRRRQCGRGDRCRPVDLSRSRCSSSYRSGIRRCSR